MATSISADGATQYVSLRMNAGLVEYSTDQSTYTPIAATANWPVTITNTAASPGPSSILRVVFTQDLTIGDTGSGMYGDTSGYFIAGSSYITFDGSNNFINIANIPLYLGFIQNGITATLTNGNDNVVVQNIKTNVTGTSTLNSAANTRGGWICASSFGRGAAANQIINCTNNGIIAFACGGICGERAGIDGGNVTITNCQNTGEFASGASSAGGIVGNRFAQSGTGYVSGCTNSANILNACGGIVGASAGNTSGSLTITNCSNTGNIIGNNAGGIICSGSGGSCIITNCFSTGAIGVIGGSGSGGIIGAGAGSVGSCIITNCFSTGDINNDGGGGIVGSNSAFNGSCTITNCYSTGVISGNSAGGIIGDRSGNGNGLCIITNCYSTGAMIIGLLAGGIAGYAFAYNTNQPCSITNCYSTGSIGTNDSGGIVGASVGFNDDPSYNPVVDISNCYSLGAIANSTGGICGGTGDVYVNPATINITNSYSFGAISGTGEGLVAASLTSPNITLTTSATYVANGTWSDTTANTNLTGDPLGVGIPNKGTTWTSISANTPYLLSSYWLLTNPTQVYTPNSVSTSSANYSSVAGSYSPGIYSIQSSSQVGSTITVNVAAVAGTSPIYYGYSNNIYTLTNSTGKSGSITASINASTGVLDFILPLPYPCFLEGTQILCLENGQEVYRPVQSLRKGDLVKTIYNGFLPIHMIGTTAMYNPNNNDRIASRLYKCPKENYPGLLEDLYITGCHSILVPWLTYEQGQKTIKSLGRLFVTDKHCRLMAWVDEKAEPYKMAGIHNIYHIALENNDYYMNYGIYANGLLVESCSKRYLMEMSNMRILGEEDCSISEDVVKAPFNITHQLVETY